MSHLIKPDLRSLSLAEMEKIFLDLNEPKFRATQLFAWVHHKGVASFDAMTNFNKELREKLSAACVINTLNLLNKQVSKDGTIKYLWGLHDGERIESVLLDDDGRKTICLSSQVGCKMGCQYCATARIKFKRNLTPGEIISQVLQTAQENGKISNLVYMGMGEPLDNYANVLKSIHIIHDPHGQNISMRKISISTCGLVPEIRKLAEEKLPITLAISLNGSIDPVRSSLMPINKRYPLDELISAARFYSNKTKDRITFEYVLIEGKNDTRQDARGIAKVLRGIRANVNLIAYNPTPSSRYQPPSNKVIKDFRWVLEDAGIEVVQRFKRGQDIEAACGQLAGKA